MNMQTSKTNGQVKREKTLKEKVKAKKSAEFRKVNKMRYRLNQGKVNKTLNEQLRLTYASELYSLFMLTNNKAEIARYADISRTYLYKLIKPMIDLTEKFKPNSKLKKMPAKPTYEAVLQKYEEYLAADKRQYDLMIVDPPYNLNLADWDSNFDFKNMMEILTAKLAKDGSIIMFNTLENALKIKEHAEENGLRMVNLMLYAKLNPAVKRKTDYSGDEWMLWLTAEDNKKPTFNLLFGESFATPVYSTTLDKREYNGGREGLKGIRKPKMLIEELVLRHSNIGDVVLAPFAGNSIEMDACLKYKRSCVTLDIEEGYIDLAKFKIRRSESRTLTVQEYKESVVIK